MAWRPSWNPRFSLFKTRPLACRRVQLPPTSSLHCTLYLSSCQFRDLVFGRIGNLGRSFQPHIYLSSVGESGELNRANHRYPLHLVTFDCIWLFSITDLSEFFHRTALFFRQVACVHFFSSFFQFVLYLIYRPVCGLESGDSQSACFGVRIVFALASGYCLNAYVSICPFIRTRKVSKHVRLI